MATKKKEASTRWFAAMNRAVANRYSKKVLEELNERQDLKSLLGRKVNSFIIWAGNERLDYEADLVQEVDDFLNKRFGFRQRLHVTNYDAWKKLTSQVFERDKYTCHYCGQVGGKLECDHIIPFSSGGDDTLENLVTACMKCNRQKYNKDYEEFLELKRNSKAN